MIIDNRATLAIYPVSNARASAVTDLLGIEPTSVHEAGDPTPSRRSTDSAAPRTYRSGAWLLDAEFEGGDDVEDQTGAGALRCLLAAIADRADAIRALAGDYEVIVWWSGDSDSGQGGFVFPADVLAGLAALGCDLYGTAYLSEEE